MPGQFYISRRCSPSELHPQKNGGDDGTRTHDQRVKDTLIYLEMFVNYSLTTSNAVSTFFSKSKSVPVF